METTLVKPASRANSTTTDRFIRNSWYVATWSVSVPPGALVPLTIMNEPIVLFRKADGTVAAITDTCPHRFAPLSMGKILPNGDVQCPYHGLEFSPEGRCVHNPHGNGAIPAAAHIRAYPVIEKHTMIWIWMGTKAPTPDTIPDYGCIDQAPPLHVTEPGYILMQAGYELIINNLLDLSHTTYLHAGILGNDETVQAEIRVTQDGDTVTMSRPIGNVTTPGLLQSLVNWPETRGDQWQSIRWMPPSCLILETGVSPVGAPKESGTGFHAIHLLTPATDHTTHYYFTAVRWNVLTEADEKNAAIRAHIGKMRLFAFAEQDAPIIEAQQRRIDGAAQPLKPVLLSIDAAPVQYARVLDRLLRED